MATRYRRLRGLLLQAEGLTCKSPGVTLCSALGYGYALNRILKDCAVV